MTTLKELLAQRAALDEQISKTKNEEHAQAVAKVRSIMAEYGLTVSDLGVGGRQAKSNRVSSKVAAKFRNKSTGETWSGRGLQPKWLKAAISGGAKLEDFAL